MEQYNENVEKNLMELVKQKEESDKHLLKLEWVIGILSMIVLFVPIFIGALVPMEDGYRLIVVVSGFLPAFVGFFYSVKIEQVAGYYKCKECGHSYVPTYKAVNLAMHMGRTRYMRCPNCGKKLDQDNNFCHYCGHKL